MTCKRTTLILSKIMKLRKKEDTVHYSTWYSRICACLVSVIVTVFLAICVLLGVLEAKFVTDFKSLTHCTHYPHGLALQRNEGVLSIINVLKLILKPKMLIFI